MMTSLILGLLGACQKIEDKIVERMIDDAIEDAPETVLHGEGCSADWYSDEMSDDPNACYNASLSIDQNNAANLTFSEGCRQYFSGYLDLHFTFLTPNTRDDEQNITILTLSALILDDNNHVFPLSGSFYIPKKFYSFCNDPDTDNLTFELEIPLDYSTLFFENTDGAALSIDDCIPDATSGFGISLFVEQDPASVIESTFMTYYYDECPDTGHYLTESQFYGEIVLTNAGGEQFSLAEVLLDFNDYVVVASENLFVCS